MQNNEEYDLSPEALAAMEEDRLLIERVVNGLYAQCFRVDLNEVRAANREFPQEDYGTRGSLNAYRAARVEAEDLERLRSGRGF